MSRERRAASARPSHWRCPAGRAFSSRAGTDALAALAAGLSGVDRKVEVIAADLATEDGLDAVATRAGEFGVDLLVLNAGTGRFGDFLAQPEAALRETVGVNVLAPAVLARRLLPGMIERARTAGRRTGVIVVSSNTAFAPVPRLAAYAASKAFDLSLAEALAAELATEPVDVLALCPTATQSRFADRAGWGRGIPGAQSPRHVAGAALRALGRQRTLVLGPISGTLLTAPALVRAAIAQGIALVLPRR
ncbi:SDR family NAD(P)-dependent oxidoreductase [Falsiroseomonas sp. E2-1-a20]|uniref:SDR family NAD(P)-dependent oxidoreductase n=1 Tax=Falsiroseomonas sp. E2-1-a20 TaxID=3239300 RepID=UPI003F3B6837